MKYLLSLALALSVVASTPGAGPPCAYHPGLCESDLSGYYAFVGENGFHGVAIITRAMRDDAYVIQWMPALTTTVYVGFGIVRDKELIVSWSDGPRRGLSFYSRHGKRGLDGRWICLPGDGKFHPEVLQFLKTAPAAPAQVVPGRSA